MPITNPTVLEDTPTDGELSKAPTSNWAVDHKADASAHHVKYTDAEAKAAAVLAGAITDAETKAPTHDAVYDVKATADGAIAKSLLTERGSVIFRNATIPAQLLHGTSGQALVTGGHGADPSWAAPAPAAHKTTHQDGGADEISVAALSGLLADSQTPLAHKASHQDGGLDEISVAALSGLLADSQTPLAHKTSHLWLGSDELNIKDNFFALFNPYYYKNWCDINGFTASHAGTGSATPGFDRIRLDTGATNGSRACIYSTQPFWINITDGPYAYRFGISQWWYTLVTTSETWVGLLASPTAPTLTQNHIAFRILNGRIYASNGNGVTGTQTDTGIDCVQYGTYKLYFKAIGASIKFYVDDVLKATHTTNIPAAVNTYITLYITNTVAASRATDFKPLVMLLSGE